MHNISCLSLAKFYNPLLAENINEQDIMMVVDLTRTDVGDNLYAKCFPILLLAYGAHIFCLKDLRGC